MNIDTPAANKVLGCTYEEMMEKNSSNQKRIRQAMWADLSHELAVAVIATTTGQVARDTVHRWDCKRKLCPHKQSWSRGSLPKLTQTCGNGSERQPVDVDPSKVPLPKTLSKGYNTVPKSHGPFSKSGDEPPYFQDSHMITPESSGRKERPDHDGGRANATRSTVRGSRRRTLDTEDRVGNTSATRINSRLLVSPEQNCVGSCTRRVSSDEWCMPFQLSFKDGALHWHRQLPKKAKRTWRLLSSSFIRYYCAQYNQTAETRYYSAKREDKEHLCDYLNRLNGLCHVQVYDIHELEEMIIEILKVDDRESAK
ncbi:hypothetical protein PHMEG_00035227 [Phytophthora megakarya]|uniref:Retrotransposon gag domain-containing protein n=1 Tax=Phytophthora megakarya TaxID=4795 RepID=A0A225UPL9_9STRA|nr:hypothetical protein PHMEG_00035227 [Phytophthora megakarya]